MSEPEVHVLPIGDLREHSDSRACWCRPRLELVGDDEDDSSVVVVHFAADGRELVERHGVN